MSRHPSVKWAQIADKLFITIELPDAQDVKFKLDPEGKFIFSATSGAEKTPYELDLDLYDKVDPNESKASITSRNICYLVKKAESKWWSRLLKQGGKPPVFLKVDWNKWIDEDEEGDDKGGAPPMDYGDFDFSNLNMGGGEDYGAGPADDNDDENDDSDSEEDDSVAKAAPAAGDTGSKPSSDEQPGTKA